MVTHFSVESGKGHARLLQLIGGDLAINTELGRVMKLIERAGGLGYRFDGIKVGPTVFAGLCKEILGTPPGLTTLSIGTSIGLVDVIIDPALPDWGMYDYVGYVKIGPKTSLGPVIEPEPWKAWQHNTPGDCPCGIARAVCDYHKP